MKDEGKGTKGKVKVLKDGRLKVFTAVKGLVRDGKTVSKVIKKERPAVVALGLAPEELDGLRKLLSDDEEEYEADLSNIDMAYAKHLTEYGDVEAPPPCFTRAVLTADELGIEVVPLDIDIETHTDIYVKHVLFSDLLRQSMRFRTVRKKRFKIETPEEFALAWDRILNRAEGFSIVEEARERCMARSLLDLLEGERDILAVIEIERAEGVIRRVLRPEPADGKDEMARTGKGKGKGKATQKGRKKGGKGGKGAPKK